MTTPRRLFLTALACTAALCPALSRADHVNPFMGRWELTIPSGAAGWLGVEQKDGELSASILWGGGSVLPVTRVRVQDDLLILNRVSTSKKKDKDGNDVEEETTETITAKIVDEGIKLSTVKVKGDGTEFGAAQFTGVRSGPIPRPPDLSKVKFGEPVELFNGKDLTGWRLIDPNSENGWKVEDGVLINRVVKEKGRHFGNLRTDAEYEDVNLKLEVRTQADSNSGVYIRGIYEVQIAETFGKERDPHNMGALYSRITPSVAAEKPIGEWQSLDITLVDQHLTVVLNGKLIIDNEAVLGCTGGALTSDESKPGPIFLQGDHTNIDFRNILLRPVVR